MRPCFYHEISSFIADHVRLPSLPHGPSVRRVGRKAGDGTRILTEFAATANLCSSAGPLTITVCTEKRERERGCVEEEREREREKRSMHMRTVGRQSFVLYPALCVRL